MLDGQDPLHIFEFQIIDDPKLRTMISYANLRTIVSFEKGDKPEHCHLLHRIDEQICCFDDSTDNVFNDFLFLCKLFHINEFFVLEFPIL